MANSASTITYDQGQDRAGQHGSIRRVIIDWTSDDATGAVTATTGKIVGQLLKVVTDPGATAPTADYDIVISDDEGVDVLSGLAGTGGTDPSLADRHTSTTEVVHLWAEDSLTDVVPGSQPYVCSTLSVAVTNAGNSKLGQIIIYYKP
tara:strand:- start:5398 stop:5841 length:444 start_codon:yes stop_codon:yes gene_type:complete